MLKKNLMIALVTVIANTAFAGLLELGPVQGKIDNLDLVSFASAQGRHGKYTMKNQAKGELHAKVFGSFRKVANAQVLLLEPQNVGNDVARTVQLVRNSKATVLRLKPSLNAPASYLAQAFEKAKQKHPELDTPKKEMDKMIAALRALGSQPLKEINMFVEKSSTTLFAEVNGNLHEIESSENFFGTLVGLWANADSNPDSSIKIVLK